MCIRWHTAPVPSARHTERLAGDRHAVSDPIAVLLVLLATAAILALAGLGIIGVLHGIAWLVGR